MKNSTPSCPCGSGKPYTACHGDTPEHLREAPFPLQRRTRQQEIAYVNKYGHTEPLPYRIKGRMREVRVGPHQMELDKAYSIQEMYLMFASEMLGQGWLKSEVEKPEHEQHTLGRWYARLRYLQEHETTIVDGLRITPVDYYAKQFLMLAHDLTVISHHEPPPEKMLERLRGRDSFQGARYELVVAATLIRADFSLEFPDETDNSRKHCDFIAVHRPTRTRIAVEAKSIHRKGVHGFREGKDLPTVETVSPTKVGDEVKGQLQKAVTQGEGEGLPFYVFVDINLPQEVRESLGQPFVTHLNRVMADAGKVYNNDGISSGSVINLLVITNFGHHFGLDNGIERGALLSTHAPNLQAVRHKERYHFAPEIQKALAQYATIPTSFDE